MRDNIEMQTLESFQETPIQFVETIGDNQIFMKREDLLPYAFGGNKVRIAQAFFADMEQQGKDCMVGYGNARSNLSRAIANMANARQIPCHIISPADDDGTRVFSFNAELVQQCGAKLHLCQKDQVADAVASVIRECEQMGLHPYYIYGDCLGHGNEKTPVSAYAQVYQEILRQEQQLRTEFDIIALATGTGMTQAGLVAGQIDSAKKKKIVGFSVARDAQKACEIIASYVKAYTGKADQEVTVIDDYLVGGYGAYDEHIEKCIMRMYLEHGIPLDPTYTGKAYAGMEQWIKASGVKQQKILFLHTGGTPLFFDYMNLKD